MVIIDINQSTNRINLKNLNRLIWKVSIARPATPPMCVGNYYTSTCHIKI